MTKKFDDSDMVMKIARQFYTNDHAALVYASDKQDVKLLEMLNYAIDGLCLVSRRYSASEYPPYIQSGKKGDFLRRVAFYFDKACVHFCDGCDDLELAVAWRSASRGLQELATLDPLSDAYLMINDMLYDDVVSEYLFTYHSGNELSMCEIAILVAQTLANYRGQNLGYMLNWMTVCNYFKRIIAEFDDDVERCPE